MARLRSKRLGQAARVGICAGALLLVSLRPVAGGEKIQITESTNRLVLPNEGKMKEMLPDPSSFIGSAIRHGESSQAPVVPPPTQAPNILTPGLRQYLDQKRNWIYQSPEDQPTALRRIFGIKEPEFRGSADKAKSVLEKYFESNRNSKSTAASLGSSHGIVLPDRNGQPGELGALDRYGSGGSSLFGARPAGIIPELNPALLFDPGLSSGGLSQTDTEFGSFSRLPQLGGLFGQKKTNPSASNGGSPDQQNSDPLLGSRNTLLGSKYDPINQQTDATRFAIDPVTARSPSAPPPQSLLPGSPDSFSRMISSPVSIRPDLYGPTRNRLLEASGPSGPVAPAAGAPVMAPKPAVLEIPRPRF